MKTPASLLLANRLAHPLGRGGGGWRRAWPPSSAKRQRLVIEWRDGQSGKQTVVADGEQLDGALVPVPVGRLLAADTTRRPRHGSETFRTDR
jgi:hypothetical protein